jgi:hypothetical protein
MTGEWFGVCIVVQSIAICWPFAVAISLIVQTLAIILTGARTAGFPFLCTVTAWSRQQAKAACCFLQNVSWLSADYTELYHMFYFSLTYKDCKWKRTSGRVRDRTNVSGVIEHSPGTMIYVPGVLQQFQGHWNPYVRVLPVGADNERG